MIRKAPDRQNERPGESRRTFRKTFHANLDDAKFRSPVLIEGEDETGGDKGFFLRSAFFVIFNFIRWWFKNNFLRLICIFFFLDDVTVTNSTDQNLTGNLKEHISALFFVQCDGSAPTQSAHRIFWLLLTGDR